MASASFYAEEVAVLGVGLIGGSFVKAMKEMGAAGRIIGYDTDATVRESVLATGEIDIFASTITSAVATADVIVLATPVRTTLALLADIAPTLKHGAKVLDLGSTKREIVVAMNRLPSYVEAVAGHPMAGKAESGWAVADGRLFQNSTFVLCPTQRTPTVAASWAEALVQTIGATPLILDADIHDASVARVSHLPYILSATLAKTAAPDTHARHLSAGGYRDTSRVAGHNPHMMRDILLTNTDNLLTLIQVAQAHLGSLEQLLSTHDEAGLMQWMQEARDQR